MMYGSAGGSGNASIFNETVVFANGLLEEGSTQVIVDFTQAQLDEGANPALGLAMVHVILHELLGAIYTYRWIHMQGAMHLTKLIDIPMRMLARAFSSACQCHTRTTLCRLNHTWTDALQLLAVSILHKPGLDMKLLDQAQNHSR